MSIARTSDLSETSSRVWSLRTAGTPMTDGNNQSSYHVFPLLVDETDPAHPRVLDEIHFVPVDSRGQLAPNSPDPIFLGAYACRNPARKLENESLLVTYARGTPRQMLGIWNEACRSALRIKEEHRPFAFDNNCLVGTAKTLQGLGHTFRVSAEKTAVTPTPVPVDEDQLRADFALLHRQLAPPRRQKTPTNNA
jgi:hypothetical protein